MRPAQDVLSTEYEHLRKVTYAETQPEYNDLPCVRLPDGTVVTRWLLDDDERDLISDTGELFLIVSTLNHPLQPLRMMADEPSLAQGEDGRPFFYSPMQHRKDQGIASFHPDNGLPDGFRDAIRSNTNIYFSFWDRVKILFGWKVRLKERIFTERRPGNTKAESQIYVYRAKPSQGQGEAVQMNLRSDA